MEPRMNIPPKREIRKARFHKLKFFVGVIGDTEFKPLKERKKIHYTGGRGEYGQAVCFLHNYSHNQSREYGNPKIYKAFDLLDAPPLCHAALHHYLFL
jgi:hypothetical protein